MARNYLATMAADTRSERVSRRVAENAAFAGSKVVISQLLLVKRLEIRPTGGTSRNPISELERGVFGRRVSRQAGPSRNAAPGPVSGLILRHQTPKSCRRAGDCGRVTVSADIHVHVVLLTVVEKWDGSIGALHAIEDNPRHGITPVVADADVVERLAVAVVDLE
jgi:hypothetical protein